MENIFLKKNKNLLYLPSYGIYPSSVNLYSELKHHFAKIFFNILVKSNIEFFVFAGSSIGLLRNNKNTPWVDDYDIVVFKEFNKKLVDEIFPILRSYNFSIITRKRNNKLSGYQIYSKETKINDHKSFFQCDIFISKVVNNDGQKFIKNNSKWGLYHRRNVPLNYVRPAKWYNFEDMYLPFFNNVKKDVELEYGDIFNTCVINVRHRPAVFILDNWENTYKKFNKITKKSKNNMKTIINTNDNKYLNRLLLKSGFKNNIVDLLNQISSQNISEILVEDNYYLLFLSDIKYYYPKVKIISNNKDLLLNNKSMLDYFDEVMFEYTNDEFPFNYKYPTKIEILNNIPEVSLTNKSKFFDFKFNEGIKKKKILQKIKKKIINIQGNNVFDLFVKNKETYVKNKEIIDDPQNNQVSENANELFVINTSTIKKLKTPNKNKAKKKEEESKTKIIKNNVSLIKTSEITDTTQIDNTFNNTVIHDYIKNNSLGNKKKEKDMSIKVIKKKTKTEI